MSIDILNGMSDDLIICTSSTHPSNPFEGQQIVETDTARILCYSGTSWTRINNYKNIGRTMCNVRRVANQSIPNNTGTYITWDTQDNDDDAMIGVPGTTFVMPTGLGGFYSMTAQIQFASSGTYTVGCVIDVAGLQFPFLGTNNYAAMAATVCLNIPDSTSMHVQALQISGAALNCTAYCYLERLHDGL